MIDKQIKSKSNCSGCYACANICPVNCISMEKDEEGFWYPKVDYSKCIRCKQCINVCPIINKKIIFNKPKAYACFNKNEKERLESSSGGIFSLVAEETIKNKGIVFGAGFDKDFNVVHSYIENKKDLYKFRGSKYVQSKVGDTFKDAKKFLDSGKRVLFTGTPCQIEGLKFYLKKDYDNLICMDNVCHGVPSPKVWKKYVDYRENKVNSKVKRVNFRNKEEGWKEFSLNFKFSNELNYNSKHSDDLFMKAFLSDICLRPSCYDCSFKGINRISDITLADFWGIQNVLPNMDDDKGTSLIFVNTDKGNKIFNKIKKNIEYSEVDINEAIKYNSAAIKSVEKNPNREKFFNDLDNLEFDKLIKKYCKPKFSVRLKRKVVFILKKIKIYDLIKKNYK